jgi:tetraacyldisaccharide 4'-kinase
LGDSLGKSDEAAMLQAALPDVPVVVNPDRVKGAQRALLNHPVDIFLLDDGFQQWRIKKDLNVVVIDATKPFGNGALLPRGILREPLGSLSRADIFVMTKSDFGKNNVEKIKEQLKRLNPSAPIAETIHQPTGFENRRDGEIVDGRAFKDKEAGILSSIGDPLSFEKTIAALGVRVKRKFIFEDHHRYNEADVREIDRCCRWENIRTLLTTTKDAVRLKPFQDEWSRELQVYILNITLAFLKGQDEFFRRIDRLLCD